MTLDWKFRIQIRHFLKHGFITYLSNSTTKGCVIFYWTKTKQGDVSPWVADLSVATKSFSTIFDHLQKRCETLTRKHKNSLVNNKQCVSPECFVDIKRV